MSIPVTIHRRQNTVATSHPPYLHPLFTSLFATLCSRLQLEKTHMGMVRSPPTVRKAREQSQETYDPERDN